MEVEDDPDLALLDKEHEIPTDAFYLWMHFQRLRRTAQGAFGVSVTTHTEIQAYQYNMDVRLEPWEVEIIMIVDSTYASMAQKVSK